MIDPEVFDCLTCGACCAPPDDRASYVDLTVRDLRRLGDARTVLVDRGGATAKLTTKRHAVHGTCCSALEGRIGRRVACGIYDDRPRGCRAFRAGSRVCRIVRAMRFGFDP
jgi:Fe-S-cluster containining protein